MNHLFLCKPLPAKWLKKERKKKKQKERNSEQPLLSSHNNEKQSAWSVGGYTGPGAEILIKASWHVKSSVIRQPIWWKELLSGCPTSGPPRRGAWLKQTRLLANRDTLFSRRDTKYKSQRAARQHDQVSLGEPVCTLHMLFAWMSCALARLGRPSLSPEQRPSTQRRLQSVSCREPLPIQEREGGSFRNGMVWCQGVSLVDDELIEYFLIPTCVRPRLALGAPKMNIHNPFPLSVHTPVEKIDYQSTMTIQCSK